VRRITLAMIATLLCTTGAMAQQAPVDAPATKEDIERYLEITHSRDMMKQMMDVMTKNARELARDQLSKDRANLPPDADERMNKIIEDAYKNFPIEEMLQAMIPIYQKHWTKGDVDNLIAFYSSPTGQKMMKDMPQTVAEAMQVMRPVMQKQMDKVRQQIEQQVVQLKKEYKAGQAKKAAPVSN
jgi:uncharacterized protein